MGPFPESQRGHQHILLIVDHFSRFVRAVPTPDQTAASVVRALLDNWIYVFGPPKRLLTDRAQNFSSELLREVLGMLKIHKVFTTAYHPQGDGMAERANGTIISILAKVVNQDVVDWDLHVSSACYAMNTVVHTATGETPHRVMYARDPPALTDLPSSEPFRTCQDYVTLAKQVAQMVAAEVNQSLDFKSSALASSNAGRTFPYKVGDLVLLRSDVVPAGHARKFHLPYQRQMVVAAVHPPAVVEVMEPGADISKAIRVNIDRIKLAPLVLQSPRYATDVTRAGPGLSRPESQRSARVEAERRSQRERRPKVTFDL
jgi:hypothetical protein